MDETELIQAGKRYKVFLVEEDDDERSHVIEALAYQVNMSYSPNYESLDDFSGSPKLYQTSVDAAISLTLSVMDDGNIMRIRNFQTEEEEDE